VNLRIGTCFNNLLYMKAHVGKVSEEGQHSFGFPAQDRHDNGPVDQDGLVSSLSSFIFVACPCRGEPVTLPAFAVHICGLFGKLLC